MVEPNTESDPAAILIQFLVSFGALVGRGPHYRVEGDEHHVIHWQWWPDPIEVPTGGGCPTQVGQSEWCRPAGQISVSAFYYPRLPPYSRCA